MNRKAGLNLLVHAATAAIEQWAREIKGMRILIVLHTLIQTLKLCVFDHYSMIPTFHHSM